MNNSLSINKVGLLFKQYYFLNRNKLLLILIATMGLIIGYHTLVHAINYRYLDNMGFLLEFHQSSFLIALLGGCLLWVGAAFPNFRSKEKRMNYLTTPASVLEKFSFEFVNRVVIFIILFPLIYWACTNLVTGLFHAFNPKYEDYLFSYSRMVPKGFTNLEINLAYSLVILPIILSFTGATYFQKLQQVKTIVSIGLIILVFVGYIFLMVKGLNLEEYSPKNDRILFMRNEKDAQLAGIIVAIIANITLLLISYFKVKEKEA